MQNAEMNSSVTICDTPTDADREAILAPLAAFNAGNGYPADPRPADNVRIFMQKRLGQ